VNVSSRSLKTGLGGYIDISSISVTFKSLTYLVVNLNQMESKNRLSVSDFFTSYTEVLLKERNSLSNCVVPANTIKFKTRMLAINMSIPNLKVARLEQF